MAADRALEIFPQIQALVLDKLQVVSYKWLSRNFLVSSNNAKRLLEEFVEKHPNELEVIYTLSGWLKSDSQTYCVKLASNRKLEEVKQTFKDNSSVQVYSVQACIPNDLAVLWNAEFVQAEELFNQPSTEENCLRDNRFCGVSNFFVKRAVDGKHIGTTALRPKNGITESRSSSSMKGQPVQSPQHGLPGKFGSENVVRSTLISSDKSGKLAPDAICKPTKPSLLKESVAGGNTSKNKGQNDKSSSGPNGSLASLWNNASAKSKVASPAAETTTGAPLAAATAEAQICAQEALDAASSEDEDHTKNFKRGTNNLSSKKRRVILDFSDDDEEEENVISLASPDLPIGKQVANSSHAAGSLLEISKSSLDEKGDRLKDKEDNMEQKSSLISSNADTNTGSKMPGGISIEAKIHSHIEQGSDKNNKDEVAGCTSSSPKRRKVLKTRIDDRGREVTEVVWEGEAAKDDKPVKNNSTVDVAKRLPVTDKAQPPGNSAPTNPVGKGGNKKPGKGGPKDAKQGNILSFFKRI
ncbi:hypothetical protein Cni_G10790 [Canna indica]|uniref:DNA polymerase delta subunit 3 n=1 Tax=Canna indica TaxID=4628 RepID=A0AAQ3QA80_9LILI|nr:hypothetical protein Cni_G10790 [Canna indica]